MRKAIRNIASIALIGLLILPQVLLLSHSHEHSNSHFNTIHQDDTCAVCDLIQHTSFDALLPETLEAELNTFQYTSLNATLQVTWSKSTKATCKTRGPPVLS